MKAKFKSNHNAVDVASYNAGVIKEVVIDSYVPDGSSDAITEITADPCNVMRVIGEMAKLGEYTLVSIE